MKNKSFLNKSLNLKVKAVDFVKKKKSDNIDVWDCQIVRFASPKAHSGANIAEALKLAVGIKKKQQQQQRVTVVTGNVRNKEVIDRTIRLYER